MAGTNITQLRYGLPGRRYGSFDLRSGVAVDVGAYSLTGSSVTATLAHTTTISAGSYLVTGNSTSLSLTHSVALTAGEYSVSGNTITATAAYTTSVDAGAYALSGNSVVVTAAQLLTLTAGEYTLTGSTIAVSTSTTVTATAGAYALTGNSISVTVAQALSLSAGAYLLTGSEVAVSMTGSVTLSAGEYLLTGNELALSSSIALTPETGSYSYIGQNVNVFSDIVLQATAGVYSLTGSVTSQYIASSISVDAGEYTLTGNTITIFRGQLITVEAGNYSVTPSNIALSITHVVPIVSGIYEYTGNSVQTIWAYTLPVTLGNYQHVGSEVQFSLACTLPITTGTYLYSGNDVSVSLTHTLAVSSGSYVHTGSNILIDISGLVITLVPNVVRAEAALIAPTLLYDSTYATDYNFCVTSCSPVFSKIRIWPQILAGATRVEWELSDKLTDDGPYEFQLQVGHTGLPKADDWTNVGAPVTDAYFAIDSRVRSFGKSQRTHYRVRLRTAKSIYYSMPQAPLGNLTFSDLTKANDIVRMERLRLRVEAGNEGCLLKRRFYGTPCSCLDPQTEEIRQFDHDECYGTGIVGGYFAPCDCIYVDQTNIRYNNNLDGGAMRGTIDDTPIVQGRMLAVPQVGFGDVWVCKNSDERWLIHGIRNVVEMRGVPLVVEAEMRLLPFSHPVYRIACNFNYPSSCAS
jgi:hypothetical protein